MSFNPFGADGHYVLGLQAERLGNSEAAIKHYRGVLALQPDHMDAIARLGALALQPPQQPLMDAARELATIPVCEITVEVRNPCNYRCFYCVAKGYNNVPVQPFDLQKMERIYREVGDKLIVTAFECGGGEPAVHPQFKELVELCARFGAISIPSNNSQDPARWLPREHAERIVIRSTIHPEAETKIDRYVLHARYLIDAGCIFIAQYIAHPTRIDRIPALRELLAGHGIPFRPTAFIGEYEGKRFPHAHTIEEQAKIGLDDADRSWQHKIEPHTTRIRNFRGIPCLGGYTSLYISRGGELRRCLYDDLRIEAPLPGATPCGVKKCGCGLVLERLNHMDTVEYEAVWARHVGRKAPPVDLNALAQKHGYASWADGAATEQAAMYDRLMDAYGKDRFPE